MAAKKTTKKASKKIAKKTAKKPSASTERLRKAIVAGADKNLKAIAAADQENARARDERAASADGMIASERAMAQTAKAPRHKVTRGDGREVAVSVPDKEPAAPATAVRAAKGGKGAGKETTKAKDAARANVAGRVKSKDKPEAKRLSAIDAAAQVLAGSKEPMSARQMIEAVAAAGLWKSPAGKTPEASLYSAIIREIARKGDASRFAKANRGLFTARKAG